MIENLLSERKFTERESKLLKQNNQKEKEILPFVTQYVYKANHTLAEFLKNHLPFPYKKGKSLKDMLLRAKKKRLTKGLAVVT